MRFDTGIGSITHQSSYSRLLNIQRFYNKSITHQAGFNRLVTVRRSFVAAITHLSEEFHKIRLPRSASITHQANKTDKRLLLTRLAQITHVPTVVKAITLFRRLASITHDSNFARRVTVRRTFNAAIVHTKRCLMKLEARLIPRGGVTPVIRKIFAVLD